MSHACCPHKRHVDMNAVCPSLQSHSSPEVGAIHTGLDVVLVVPPWLGLQVGLSLLQTSPLCRLLLFGELPPHLLTDHLLQHTHNKHGRLPRRRMSGPCHCTTDTNRCRCVASVTFHSFTNWNWHSLATVQDISVLAQNCVLVLLQFVV